MPFLLTALPADHTRRKIIRRIKIVPTGSYASPDPIDLTAITNPNFHSNAFVSTVPTIDQLTLESVPGGYDCQIVPGAGNTLATAFAVKFFSTAGTEIAAAAYPAALLAAVGMVLKIEQSNWS